MCFAPQRSALFRHLNFQKWSIDNGVFLYILTWKCASRHNGVHFFDIASAKRGPTPSVFCAFWLGNVLRATTACTFFDISTSKSGPRMVCFVHFDFEMCFAPQRRAIFSSLIWPAGSAPAALASLLFDPPVPQITGKIQRIATFLPFLASASSFFLLFLFYSSFF